MASKAFSVCIFTRNLVRVLGSNGCTVLSSPRTSGGLERGEFVLLAAWLCVQVFGRRAGFIALQSSLASGVVDICLIPGDCFGSAGVGQVGEGGE